MNDWHFLLPALALIALVYGALRSRGEAVGWWLGLVHGVLALVAMAGFGAARDTGFAVFTGLLAVYAGAMCAAEAVHLARRPVPHS
ncbi:hypothetical protein [Ancylobacter sp. TS-1]|uniref:hypothetical protein n=1 Tax=Ancylobacter sp. TS-1 TaxID=1850374 RepID=UPI001265BD51|nr:hypothetical protein [Ancylobacter sp. TS-1]QFR33466.1 hypothetical protein GBB76_10160 [Ancylobacter sp. TS-1]